jgi:hypothetical protein
MSRAIASEFFGARARATSERGAHTPLSPHASAPHGLAAPVFPRVRQGILDYSLLVGVHRKTNTFSRSAVWTDMAAEMRAWHAREGLGPEAAGPSVLPPSVRGLAGRREESAARFLARLFVHVLAQSSSVCHARK